MIYGYIRVSTEAQSVLNQRYEIRKFCDSRHIKIDGWIHETISGTKHYQERELGDLLRRIKGGDVIICTELSRLGRSLFMIMQILSICMEKDCKVWTIKDRYRLGDNIQSKVLAFAFALSAEIERNLISQRTKQALERKKSEGLMLGRPLGAKNKLSMMSEKEFLVDQMLQDGLKRGEIAHLLGVSKSTLMRYLKRNNLCREYHYSDSAD